MALAEALKSNTTLEYLESAALPIEPTRPCLVAAPSHLTLRVAGWMTTASATMPSRPSERRPAAASS